jgi:hypothetical protein
LGTNEAASIDSNRLRSSTLASSYQRRKGADQRQRASNRPHKGFLLPAPAEGASGRPSRAPEPAGKGTVGTGARFRAFRQHTRLGFSDIVRYNIVPMFRSIFCWGTTTSGSEGRQLTGDRDTWHLLLRCVAVVEEAGTLVPSNSSTDGRVEWDTGGARCLDSVYLKVNAYRRSVTD